LQREKGRALRGKKVECTKRGRRFKRVNVIGGMCGGKYMALEYYSHTTTSEFFESWFSGRLLPVVPKGYTIIMDNASFHRRKQLFDLATKAEVGLLFLPAYSPDFNSIEHSWANMKRWLADNLTNFSSLEWALDEYLNWHLPHF